MSIEVRRSELTGEHQTLMFTMSTLILVIAHSSCGPGYECMRLFFVFVRANFCVRSRLTRFYYVVANLTPTWCDGGATWTSSHALTGYIDTCWQGRSLPVPPCWQRVLPSWSCVPPPSKKSCIQTNYTALAFKLGVSVLFSPGHHL